MTPRSPRTVPAAEASLQPDDTGPLGRPTLRVVLPFLALGVLGIVGVLVPPSAAPGRLGLAATVLLVVSLGFAALSLRRDRRTWVDPVGPWLFIGCVALVDHATGGSQSGLVPLLMLPVAWLALFGTARDLLVAAALTAATLLGPLVVIGGENYPVADWRRGVLWVAIVLVVAPVIQGVVRRLGRATEREREAASQVSAMLRGATLSSMVLTDPQGRIQSLGVGAERLLGYRLEQVAGHPVTLLHEADELERVAGEHAVPAGFAGLAALAARSAPSRIWTYVRADGERRSVRLAVTEVRDGDRLTGYLHVAIDASRDIATRRELEASEARWRGVMESLVDLTVLVLDEDLRVEVATGAGAMRTLLGDARGKHLSEISKPENVALVARLTERALAGEVARADLNATVSGAEHDLVVRALPDSPDGRRMVLLLARDVSEEREQQRQVEAARDKAERLFADSPHGIALLDSFGVVVRANAALVALLDRPAAMVTGWPLQMVGRPGDDTLTSHLADVLDGPTGRASADWTLLTPDDQEVHVELSSTLLHDEDEGGAPLVLANLTDISERRRHEDQLAHLADHDPLTGLANRRKFNAELTRHVEFCARYGSRGALMLLDLDHFKEVNDTLGHSAGDQLIVSVAAVLRRTVRTTDLVARLGGDEFAILLQETEREGAERAATAVVGAVRDHVSTLDGTHQKVSASVGVVMVDGVHATPSELLAAADMTMYDAKDAGRDRWTILDSAHHGRPRTSARIAWAQKVESAVGADDFELHLQPIWDVARQRVTGAEALLRMRDGDELVYPDRFLYVAERSDLVKQVDEWVLRTAVPLLASLQRRDPDFRLEVNLSGRSLGSARLERVVREAVHENAVDARGLVLEVTETAAVADVATARAFAERVGALGCRFALDDFGAGFGSFYYLKHLVFDYVKIDGEFVSGCPGSATDRAILGSIVGIARDLGKRTVAEFVSDQAVLDVVTREGVDFAQGYHIGRPVPVAEFCARHLPEAVPVPPAATA